MIKIGIFGYGRIGKIHFENLNNNSDVTVSFVVDPFISDEHRNDLCAKGVSVYSDYLEAFENTIDAVYICSASDTHVDIALEAVKRGISIFCEKPIDKDINKVKQLTQAVENSDIIFQVGFNRRYDHNFAAIKKEIENKTIGDVHSIKITSRDPEAPGLDYVKSSGGIFNDMSIHDLDMIRNLSTSEVDSVYAIGDALVNPEIKQYDDVDSCMITIQFKDGSCGVIDNSRQAVYGYDQRAEVFGSLGQLSIKNDTSSTLEVSTKLSVASEKPLYFFLERYMDSFNVETQEFVECLKNKTTPKVILEDGFMAMLLAVAAKRSLDTKQPVYIDELKKEYDEKGL